MGLWWHASGNSVRSRESKGLGHPDQPGEGIGLHLLHDSRAVGFDRLLADPQLAGDLLVKPAGDDECEHLRLAWRESRDPSFDLGDPGSLVQIADILLDGPTHRFQQNIGAIGLSDEIHRARLHRADASRDVTVPSDEDDRHGLLALGERRLQLQPP